MSTPADDGRKEKGNISKSADANSSGIGGTRSYEHRAAFRRLSNEKVIDGYDDTYIVLGRDRNGSEYSGKGGVGYTKCGAIDIVAGRTTNKVYKQNKEQIENGTFLNPSFSEDAARIYISQKTDVDLSFAIPSSTHGIAQIGSAIAAKADNIRIMARESVKIVSSMSTENSSGLQIPGAGIELIAIEPGLTLDDYLSPADDPENPVMQPIPKGDNLRLAFEEVLGLLNNLAGLFTEYVALQTELNHYFASHTHLETFYGNQGIPSIDVSSPLCINNIEVQDYIINGLESFVKNNLNQVRNKYIVPGTKKYINSTYHYLN
jgi:hypothetical protein